MIARAKLEAARRGYPRCSLHSSVLLVGAISVCGVAICGCSSGAHPAGNSSASSGSAASSGGSAAASGAAGEAGAIGLPSGPRGCGQGTSCTPGDDLAAPASADGVQVETPDNGITVQPGQEAFLCFYRTLPTTSDINVGTIQSWMTPSSSHHFIAYEIPPNGGTFGGRQQPDGTLATCLFGGGTWLYATSVPGQVIEMKMPDGVGLPLPTGTQVMLNMHFINPGTTPANPKVKLNLLYAQNVQYKAAAMVSFNIGINVPPATSAGPGTQTVSGSCSAPVGSKFFVMTSHTHKHATVTDVNYLSGGQTTNIVHTTDWEHPDVALWGPPDFLTVKSGDSFTYSCSYANDSSSPVTVGETAASNEMCMAIGYYFPAGGASCR
jgi:hypothetical protein